MAGDGISRFSGDNGPASAASLASPTGVAVDSAGNLFIVDSGNSRIRRVDAVTQIITTVAGNGQLRFDGDNGPATAASLNFPTTVVLDTAGNLFIAERNRVRAVRGKTAVVLKSAPRRRP